MKQTFHSRCLATGLLWAVSLLPRLVNADPAPSELATARRAFESAVRLESAGEWAGATVKLNEALAVKDTPGLRFHLAHCEAEQGFLVEAALDYDRADALLKKGAKAPDVQRLLGPAHLALQARLPRLGLDLPNGVNEPLATVDGTAYPVTDLARGVFLDPGPHELSVSASGRRPFKRSLILKEGEQARIQAELPVVAATAPVGDSVRSPPLNGAYGEPLAPPATHSSTKLYLMLGESLVTVVGLSVGIGYRVAKSSATDRVAAAQTRIDDESDNDPGACGGAGRQSLGPACADVVTAIGDRDRAARLSTVGFISAGVGAAALITTWLTFPNARREVSGVTLQPLAGIGSLGVRGGF